MIEIRRYPEQDYFCYFDSESGLFARVESEGASPPFWAERGPELLDISITNWCDKDCRICYRASHLKGRHMALRDYELVLEQATDLNLFQVALGGGNPNQHPDFPEILRLTRRKYGVVPSYTTNGRGLSRAVLDATREFCGAVAVSAHPPVREIERAIVDLHSYSIKTNVHFVLSVDSLPSAIKWLTDIPVFLRDVNAVIFLTYKPAGRKGGDSLVVQRGALLTQFFEILVARQFPFKIGFDSCSVSGIVSNTAYEPTTVEPCEAARFSAFVSEDLEMFPCSFMLGASTGDSLRRTAMKEIWHHSRVFNGVRNKLRTNQCGDCHHYEHCLGGCPVFDVIRVCRGCQSGPSVSSTALL